MGLEGSRGVQGKGGGVQGREEGGDQKGTIHQIAHRHPSPLMMMFMTTMMILHWRFTINVYK